jgi:hypothetical protein
LKKNKKKIIIIKPIEIYMCVLLHCFYVTELNTALCRAILGPCSAYSCRV